MLALGCDMGALAAKTVLLEDGRLIDHDVTTTDGLLAGAANVSLQRILDRTGLTLRDLPRRGGTGWGRKYINYDHHPETIINCLAAGAFFLRPGARTVVDLGGLTAAVINLNDQGKVLEYRNNDRCASGTGFFVELAAQALELRLEELNRVVASATGRVHIGAQCAVFGESEIVSHVNQGVEPADILAGVVYAIGAGAATTVRRLGVVPEILVSGGVAKLDGVLAALSEKLGVEAVRPEVDPQIVGALGAALIAARREPLKGGE
ncbi:MAG: acyl-CoA dehydratase activase [Pseudomonadota bacterium]